MVEGRERLNAVGYCWKCHPQNKHKFPQRSNFSYIKTNDDYQSKANLTNQTPKVKQNKICQLNFAKKGRQQYLKKYTF